MFRKKVNESLLKDKAATKIVNLLLKLQVKFSKVMSSFIKKISVKKLKVLLVVFCVLGGGSSIYLIAEAIFKDEQPALKIEGINVPKYLDQGGDLQSGKYVEPESYKDLQSFRRYMDSVQQIKDSIWKVTPGSMDSLKLLKEIFNSKIKL
jgi:hypothetical protein